MYIDYTEYLKFGGDADEAAFKKYVYDAQARINAETHGRIREANEPVKRCMARLIDIYQKADVLNEKVQSWSNDGVSKSFKEVTPQQYEAKIKGIIREYLANEVGENGTPLLYLGVR